jgi:multisubunit Na+/H+ antiporter MnhB subunit
MSLDRYLIFKIQNWKKVYFDQKNAMIAGLCLTIFIFLLNLNVVFLYGHEFVSNGTKVVQCFSTIPSTYWMEVWSEVHSYLYSFIPFVVLAVANILLIVDLQKKTQENNQATNSVLDAKSKLNINLSVIIITVMFIVFTCPSAIASQYYNVLVATIRGRVILYACDCFAFSFHALNILILLATNKQFVRKCKEAFGIKEGNDT